MSKTVASRRQFLAGAGVAAAATAALGTSAALADEATDAAAADVPAWLGEAPTITDADCTETVETEILVCGAGDAGMFCAMTAAQQGAKVLLIDPMEQGFGIRCSALGAVDSSLQKENNVEIDKMEIVNDVVHYADGVCDMRIWKMWADESGEAIDWYVDECTACGGLAVENEYNMPEGTRYHDWPTGHATLGTEMKWANEPVILEYLINELNATEGCEHRGYTKLVELIVEGGKVTGAYCATGEDFDSYIRVNASRGVVVATGGYVLNRDMMHALQPDVMEGLSTFFTSSQVFGEGIKACMWAGAALEPNHTTLVFDRGAVHPDEPLGDGASTPGQVCLQSQPFLKVNSNGERFCNESSPYDFVFHAANKFADKAWYPIWDANYLNDVDRFHTVGCSTQLLREGGDHLMGNDPDTVVANVEASVEEGTCIKADTLEELAEGLGINAENLVKTVERYNELFDAQEDTDFGKEAFRLSEIRTAPFYGLKLGGIALCTMSGIEITPECEALDNDGQVIEGLYVIGNDAGNKYNKTYPNFAAGLNAGLCATMGRHVAKALAAK